jgi:regulator of RNase E activity RraA
MIGCGGVAVCPGDIMVCDNDGALVIPASMADEVAEAGLEQELFEGFVQQRIGEGASVVGLYPPDAQALEDYRKWLAARQPS